MADYTVVLEDLPNKWDVIVEAVKNEAYHGMELYEHLKQGRIRDVLCMDGKMDRVRVDIPDDSFMILFELNAEEWIQEMIRELYDLYVIVIVVPVPVQSCVQPLSTKVIAEINDILCVKRF